MSLRSSFLPAIALLLGAPLLAAVGQQDVGLFESKTRSRVGGVIGTQPRPLAALAESDPLRVAWDRVPLGAAPRIWIDERSGLPSLVTPEALSWFPQRDPGQTDLAAFDVERTADRAREFLARHVDVFGAWDDQLVLNEGASGQRGANLLQVRFDQVVGGVPVEGARFDFQLHRGQLAGFGATRWAPVRISAEPTLSAAQARAGLDRHVQPTAEDRIVDLHGAELLLLPLAMESEDRLQWTGSRGEGYTHRLIWRFRFTDRLGLATWTGEIDAHSGEIVAFYDDTQYDRIKGAVSPISDDGICAEGGCPLPDFPMPYTDYSVDGGVVQYADQHGHYQCVTTGTVIETHLDGKYFSIEDQCGEISELALCDGDIDLGISDDINCGAAAGASPGNTDGARSAYYSLNAVNRKARFWSPGNSWLEETQVLCRTHLGGSCNASWNGALNMLGASDFCGDTAELQGLVTHEWGHGFDSNDGGGQDNPSEAYADITAIFEARESCMGRGFHIGENCTGYGDTCLDCTGLREMDWDARLSHTPATLTGFLNVFCPSGGGPCGKEVHCESYLASEAMFDLAARDLPAMGLDGDTAWQLAERLWYQSRSGSGGDAYNCSAGSSDSCSVGSWYHQLRVQDDDDGNLNNGTPHAAAIFAAFDRHEIACGTALDPENQNASSCPALGAPVPVFAAQDQAVDLSWSAVPGAAGYRIYRNEIGCSRGQFPIAETDASTTNYLDDGLGNGQPVFYRVQAIGSNGACEGPVSACLEAGAQQLAGRVRFGQPAYDCSDAIQLEVTDVNHPTASMSVSIWSDVESTPESVTLVETPAGSARFIGSIQATIDPPASDGLLSVTDGATMTAEYIDLDDGAGGSNVPHQAIAGIQCGSPIFTSVSVSSLTDATAKIDWSTSTVTTGQVEWGLTPALGSVVSAVVPGSTHAADIGPFSECERVYFRVSVVDALGHVGVADAGGLPFEFNGSTILGIVYEDGFETDLGWTLQSDWEIGVPQGLGSAPGDPTAASVGAQVLGQDLSGQGARPGDYEFNTTFSATSPPIDTSAFGAVELRFERWLNYPSSGDVAIQALDGNGVWQSVWTQGSGSAEISWSSQAYDISPSAAGNPALQLRFIQVARFGFGAGWNIDRLQLRDSSQTTFGACGSCQGAPSFPGLASAVDESCAGAGIRLSWISAPAWGSGESGTYSIYRDTVPGFTAGPANRIAAGVVGTTWVDSTAPTDVDVHYLVRAENDESCAGGANNGGLTDGNLVYVTAIDVAGQTLPGNVGNSLLLDAVAPNDVRLGWNSVNDASNYRIYRSSTPQGSFVLTAESIATSFDDSNTLTDGQTWFYLVTAVNDCGGESSN